MNTDESLSKIFDMEPMKQDVITIEPSNVQVIETSSKIESDYDKTRDNLNELLLKGKEALETALTVAKQSEHPRAFEVVGNLMKQIADINTQLMDLHQQKQKLDAPKDAAKNEEAKSLPNTTDEDPRNSVGNDTDDEKDPIISLSYRIDELEKALKMMTDKFASAFPEEGQEVSSLEPSPVAMSKEEDEELPKLDGAPIEKGTQFSSVDSNRKTYGKARDAQSNFLAKLYK